jgi:hypothetical protein
MGYRKGPGRAGGKLTRSILLNSGTIPKRKESGSGREELSGRDSGRGTVVSVVASEGRGTVVSVVESEVVEIRLYR